MTSYVSIGALVQGLSQMLLINAANDRNQGSGGRNEAEMANHDQNKFPGTRGRYLRRGFKFCHTMPGVSCIIITWLNEG